MRGKEGLFFPSSVVPAQAGIPLYFLRRRKRRLDPCLRGDDGKKGWALLLIALGLFLALLLATPALAQTAAPDSSGALTRSSGMFS